MLGIFVHFLSKSFSVWFLVISFTIFLSILRMGVLRPALLLSYLLPFMQINLEGWSFDDVRKA